MILRPGQISVMLGSRLDPKQTRAFSLIEVLVVISLVSLLLGLFIPAVQRARETSRCVSCSMNLHSLGVALSVYHDGYGSYPPGRVQLYDPRFAGPKPSCTSYSVDKSFLVSLLPYVDQQTLFTSINTSVSVFSAENSTIHTLGVAVFACPSDYTAGYVRELPYNELAMFGLADLPGSRHRMWFSSYVGSVGPFPSTAFPSPRTGCRVNPIAVAQNMGVFCDVSPIGYSAITDGLSSTILISERGTLSLQGFDYSDDQLFQRFGWYVSGNWGDTLFTTFYPANYFKLSIRKNLEGRAFSASSAHASRINVLFGDGSARFVSTTIDSWVLNPNTGKPLGVKQASQGWWLNAPRFGIWQALSTRASSDMVDLTAF
jgi:prepilin-type N-terminal cleavage/methylation domain-containing protein/prepilin-type processing-associated H-X9-DG protein